MGLSWKQKPFHVPHFLLVGKRLQPPKPSLSSKGQIQIITIRGAVFLSSSTGTKPPIQVEDDSFRLSISAWTQKSGSCNTTLLPHYRPIRARSHTLPSSSQILPIKTLPSKSVASSGLLSTNHHSPSLALK